MVETFEISSRTCVCKEYNDCIPCASPHISNSSWLQFISESNSKEYACSDGKFNIESAEELLSRIQLSRVHNSSSIMLFSKKFPQEHTERQNKNRNEFFIKM